jgi:oligopeptide/dipeptide ABC transporter ATP-binding protein
MTEPHRNPEQTLLSIRGLRTSFGNTEVLHGVDLEIRRGEVLTLIGESGSGKSVLARSILGLAGKNARTTGVIEFNGTNLLDLTDAEMHKMRGADIGIIVQDAMAALNPMRTIGYQLCETIVYRHPDYRDNPHNKTTLMASEEVKKLAVDYLKRVGITAPSERMRSYAHQLSGGMRQRVMIALALIGAPKLLIADEPTTALDVVVQREILKELREIVKSESMSMLLVTHDLHLARDVADRVSVMYAGYILETGPVPRVLPNPAHPYTEGLLDAMPDMESEKGTLQPIKGEIPPPDKLGHGCPFAGRCPLTRVQCRMTLPAMQPVEEGWQSRCMEAQCHAAQLDEAFKAQEQKRDQAVVKNLDKVQKIVQVVEENQEAQGELPVKKATDEVDHEDDSPLVEASIAKHCYYTRKGFFGRKTPWNVLEDIELTINRGEVLGLVGESGCGKSSLARLLLGLMRPTSGRVTFDGELYPEPRTRQWRAQRPLAQMIYQDPFSCFDERLSIVEQVAEPLMIHKGMTQAEAQTVALRFLKASGLPEHHAVKRPGVMSGGQLQRAAIARAIALEPKLLVCDEPVASLDVSIQAQVLELLNNLRRATDMSMLFVSHNLNVVRYICDRVMVMYLGRIVETGSVEEVFRRPVHPYTRLLTACTPGANGQVVNFYPKGAMPSPMNRPKGCVFANRCPLAGARCQSEVPPLQEVLPGRCAACFEAEKAMHIDDLYLSSIARDADKAQCPGESIEEAA